MKNYDLLIVGDGIAAATIPPALSSKFQRIAVIRLSGAPETYFSRLLAALAAEEISPRTGDAALRPLESKIVEIHEGACVFLPDRSARVGGEALTAQQIVLNAGCVSTLNAFPGIGKDHFLSPLDALQEGNVPSSVVMVGGGPVGTAVAEALVRKGCRVSLISAAASLLPKEEPEIGAALETHLRARGVEIFLSARATEARQAGGEVEVLFAGHPSAEKARAQKAVWAAGLRPNTSGLGLENLKIFIHASGRVVINDEMRASRPGVWAAGPMTGAFEPSLEIHQAGLIANNLQAPFFSVERLAPEPLPFALPMPLAFARVGRTEEDARREFKDTVAAMLPTSDGGLVKIVGRGRGGELLGVHVLSPRAAEMILYGDLLLQMEIPLHDITEEHHFPAATKGKAIFEAIREWRKKAG